jgi:hypothetical protein
LIPVRPFFSHQTPTLNHRTAFAGNVCFTANEEGYFPRMERFENTNAGINMVFLVTETALQDQ